MKKLPFNKAKLEEIAKRWPTPFHIYDEAAIRDNAKRLAKAFSWNKGWREFFAVKATPNPHILALLAEYGFGADCSSMAELIIAEKCGLSGDKIMFTSNDTPAEEFRKAWQLQAVINLDDISHWPFLLESIGPDADFTGRIMCCRYNPGPLKGGNAIIGKPEEAKYGMTREQLFDCYAKMQARGVKRFGLHTMVASNELDPEYIIDTAKLLFNLAAELKERLNIDLEFVNIGGGIGIPYKSDQSPMDYQYVSSGIQTAYKDLIGEKKISPLKLYMECGRCITGPYGYLVSKVLHIKNTYRLYAGLDACMSNLMRPAMYGAYHEIVVPGKEDSTETSIYDVTGSLCENNDKFAIQRMLPVLAPGDLVVICDAGAHGHAMGFQYNGKLRSAELLLKPNGDVKEIRRAETLDDYFSTVDFDSLEIKNK